MSESYSPSTLGSIDEVRVVDLRAVEVLRVSQYMDVRDAPEWVVQGDDAQVIAARLRSLPSAEQMRCHTPPLGLRFLHGGQALLDVSLCWACNNAFGYAENAAVHFRFAGDCDSARELLALLRRVAGMAGPNTH